MNEALILLAIVLTGVSGIPGVFFGRASKVGERVAAMFMLAGSIAGLVAVFRVALSETTCGMSRPWGIPGGELSIRIDGVSAMFLAPIFLIAPLGSIYGLGYWSQAEHPHNGRKLRLFYGILTAALALLVVAHNSLLFLMAWETMALAAFLLITTEDEHETVRES